MGEFVEVTAEELAKALKDGTIVLGPIRHSDLPYGRGQVGNPSTRAEP